MVDKVEKGWIDGWRDFEGPNIVGGPLRRPVGPESTFDSTPISQEDLADDPLVKALSKSFFDPGVPSPFAERDGDNLPNGFIESAVPRMDRIMQTSSLASPLALFTGVVLPKWLGKTASISNLPSRMERKVEIRVTSENGADLFLVTIDQLTVDDDPGALNKVGGMAANMLQNTDLNPKLCECAEDAAIEVVEAVYRADLSDFEHEFDIFFEKDGVFLLSTSYKDDGLGEVYRALVALEIKEVVPTLPLDDKDQLALQIAGAAESVAVEVLKKKIYLRGKVDA